MGCAGYFRLLGLIREKRIDTVFSFLIHANAVAAVAARFMPGVRFIQSIQTTQAKPAWHWAVQNAIQGAAEVIVVPSPSAAEAAENFAGVDRRKILVIPNAVDLPEEAAGTEEDEESHVGFIGRLDAIKRVPDLVTAVSMLFPPVILDIFGEGEERKNISAAIESLDLKNRVILHGAVAGPVGALASIDVLVLPSDAEGFGLVLIEAMAAGVPVIGTNVPGIRDVIENGMNGLLVPAQSAGAGGCDREDFDGFGAEGETCRGGSEDRGGAIYVGDCLSAVSRAIAKKRMKISRRAQGAERRAYSTLRLLRLCVRFNRISRAFRLWGGIASGGGARGIGWGRRGRNLRSLWCSAG